MGSGEVVGSQCPNLASQGWYEVQPTLKLTLDRVFHWLTSRRSASPILPTAPVPDPRLSHAELTPSKFLSLRLQRNNSFFEQIFQPVRDAVAGNECAGLGVPP